MFHVTVILICSVTQSDWTIRCRSKPDFWHRYNVKCRRTSTERAGAFTVGKPARVTDATRSEKSSELGVNGRFVRLPWVQAICCCGAHFMYHTVGCISLQPHNVVGKRQDTRILKSSQIPICYSQINPSFDCLQYQVLMAALNKPK